jgi:hypothetical protein
MKTRQHHIDLVESQDVVSMNFHSRTAIQMEMIQDHAYLTGMSIDEAAMDWIENGWADKFREHYPHTKSA